MAIYERTAKRLNSEAEKWGGGFNVDTYYFIFVKYEMYNIALRLYLIPPFDEFPTVVFREYQQNISLMLTLYSINVFYYFYILRSYFSKVILTTEKVITAALKVISATTNVILATEEAITAYLKIISATTKVILATNKLMTPTKKLSRSLHNLSHKKSDHV